MPRSPLTAAGVLLAVIAAATVVLERDARWQRLRGIAGSRSVPGEAVGSTRFGTALGRLGLLHPIPLGRRLDAPAQSLGPIPARRGSTPDQLTLGRPRGHHLRAAYRLQGSELAKRAPAVSLLVPEAELERMQRHSFLRGRASERAAYVGFFEDGDLKTSTGAGVRIHGGATRGRRSWLGYRLIARRGYGEPTFSPAPFPDMPEPSPERLVLRANRGRDRHGHMWHFSSPLAMDIARRIGVPAPRSRPVAFFLNGVYEGVYELSDYLGPDFVRKSHGVVEPILVRTKQNQYEAGRPEVKAGPEAPYQEFRQRVLELKAGTVREDIGDWVDLDNLCRWLIAVSFLDTQDAFQGALVRDLADPASRWFWIAWDTEISFGLPQRPFQMGWRSNTLPRLLASTHSDARRVIFRWLLERPAGRRRFLSLAVEALNHRIDDAFLAERLQFYRDRAELFELSDRVFLDELTDFLTHRPAAYREQLRTSIARAPARRVRITGPAGSRLEIDGHPTGLPWQGDYFDGMGLRLAAAPGTRLSINGAPHTLADAPLEIALAADQEIVLLPPS